MQAASAVARSPVRPLHAVGFARNFAKPGAPSNAILSSVAALQGGPQRARHVVAHAAATDAAEETFTYQAEV